MTAELTTKTTRTVRLRTARSLPGIVRIEFIEEDGYRSTAGEVKVGALLDAVRTELNVFVIDRADLPVMDAEKATARLTTDGGRPPTDPWSLDDARTFALQFLAAVEYLEAHPPVDEQQVEALAELLRTADVASTAAGHVSTSRPIARALLATGKVTVQS